MFSIVHLQISNEKEELKMKRIHYLMEIKIEFE
jgi:hypothetical protein